MDQDHRDSALRAGPVMTIMGGLAMGGVSAGTTPISRSIDFTRVTRLYPRRNSD
jgi:hypothetical protein